jgi:hypothetical protein
MVGKSDFCFISQLPNQASFVNVYQKIARDPNKTIVAINSYPPEMNIALNRERDMRRSLAHPGQLVSLGFEQLIYAKQII